MTGPETMEPDGTAEFSVQATDYYGDPIIVNYGGFELEAVDGYVPHRRLRLVDGVGKFKAIALGLQSGETMRIKLNMKYRTGLAQWVVKVK